MVQGIQILCDGERHGSPFKPVEITPTHQIYGYGDVCPVSEAICLPIVMFRHSKEHPLNKPPTPWLDNQIATYLMIEVDSGFAPMMYVIITICVIPFLRAHSILVLQLAAVCGHCKFRQLSHVPCLIDMFRGR